MRRSFAAVEARYLRELGLRERRASPTARPIASQRSRSAPEPLDRRLRRAA
jgi:hypothetical protein